MAAKSCNAKTSMACMGARGTHLTAKKATIGNWHAMSSC